VGSVDLLFDRGNKIVAMEQLGVLKGRNAVLVVQTGHTFPTK
jgi:hypothetical protein